MNQEKINVVGLELLERAVDGPFDLFWLMKMIPDLCADENVGALDGWVLLAEILKSVTDLALVLVEPGAVKMTVASLQRAHDCPVGLALVAFAGKGAETDTWHLGAILKSECSS